MTDQEKFWNCAICDEIFQTFYSLRGHVIAKHEWARSYKKMTDQEKKRYRYR